MRTLASECSRRSRAKAVSVSKAMAVAATHAALLLAQGSGRLIRRLTDRGVVAVLDPRLITARYGNFLRASMPDFWMTTDEKRPGKFEQTAEDEGLAASGGTRLSLRYHWSNASAEAFWNDPRPSPILRVEAQVAAKPDQGFFLVHGWFVPPRRLKFQSWTTSI